MGAAAPLGEMLLKRGLISDDQLRIALIEQKASGHLLGRLLVQLGFLSESGLLETLGERLGCSTVDIDTLHVDPQLLHRVPRDLARRHRFLPFMSRPDNSLLVAMAHPDNLAALDQLKALLQHSGEIEVVLAAESDILRAIDHQYGFELSIDGILKEIETGEVDERSLSGTEAYAQPVVRLVDALLNDCVQRQASDLHFEPEAGFVRIRYRIDGVLRQIRCLHSKCWPAMIVRLKVICGMNIAETRAPQDGRLSLELGGRTIDFRAASHPCIGGENFTLRVLDRRKSLLTLEALELEQESLGRLKQMMARPEGLLLVTGPTGSGKTTTLYSMLAHINRMGINIMTLEDPVEYPLPLLRQTSIGDGNKIDFAAGIRSTLRQDPDVILVGEIRDPETAAMALRAAMTGHQVYSTLHSNSAVGAIPRLLDMGIRRDVLANSLIGIIGQRLIRRLCPYCRQSYRCTEHDGRLYGLPAGATLYRAGGCTACDQQGYRGRVSVFEVLRMDAELDDMVARGASARELGRAAGARAFRSLADDGLRRVMEGVSSIEEVSRVVDLSEQEVR